MKSYISFILIGCLYFFSPNLNAQTAKDTIWYDANWNIADKAVASYYRPYPEAKDNGYWLVDYYISGKKQMEAWSKQPDSEFFNGTVTWYHENGNVMQTVNYSDNVLKGDRKNYHTNGKLKSQYSYENGKINGEWVGFYENSTKDEEGQYKDGQRVGAWKEYHKDGRLKSEGNYKDGKKIGEWKMYYYDGIDDASM